MKSVNDINVDLAANLKNKAQRNAMMTRESRRIIDREEANMDILVRSYLLTKDRRYADEAIKRVKDIATWKNSKNVVGDFNFRHSFPSVPPFTTGCMTCWTMIHESCCSKTSVISAVKCIVVSTTT